MIDINEARQRATEALERAEKAAPAPWCLVSKDEQMFIYAGPVTMPGGPAGPPIVQLLHGHDYDYECDDDLDNQSFLVMAPRDVPQLAQDLLEALEEIERLRQVCECGWSGKGSKTNHYHAQRLGVTEYKKEMGE